MPDLTETPTKQDAQAAWDLFAAAAIKGLSSLYSNSKSSREDLANASAKLADRMMELRAERTR